MSQDFGGRHQYLNREVLHVDEAADVQMCRYIIITNKYLQLKTSISDSKKINGEQHSFWSATEINS